MAAHCAGAGTGPLEFGIATLHSRGLVVAQLQLPSMVALKHIVRNPPKSAMSIFLSYRRAIILASRYAIRPILLPQIFNAIAGSRATENRGGDSANFVNFRGEEDSGWEAPNRSETSS